MRNVDAHLLGDKMDEAVTHYINTHQPSEHVHIDTDGMPITVQDDGSRITVMHQQTYSTHHCRQVSVSEPVGEGPWSEELLDPEGRIAAIVAHLAQNSRTSHHHPHHKVSVVRNEVDASVILDNSIRYNGQSLDQQSVSLSGLPPMQTLPPLQEMKRCETDWFSDDKNKKSESQLSALSESDGGVLELGRGSGVGSRQQSRKSLPHKKRISRKLKRNGSCTPQQDLVVINSIEPVVTPVVEDEQILPDNFVAQQQSHHMSHEVRPIFICQICGDFYGEEQLKFFHHLKQHYEPHSTIIIDNPVSDLVMDKMTNTCIVDNVAALPDSIVELSLENSVPKTMYQPIDKHAAIAPLAYNTIKVQYSMASMDKEPVPVEAEKTDLYETLDKLELYNCGKCSKTFRKQKQCEAHMREAHPINTKMEDMGEFSEPEDLMAGIHVCVGEYEPPLLPHLTVDNGHVHQDHTRHWYSRNGTHINPCEGCNDCNPDTYCAECDRDPEPTHPIHPTHPSHPAHNTQQTHDTHPIHNTHQTHSTHDTHSTQTHVSQSHTIHAAEAPHTQHPQHTQHSQHSQHTHHVTHPHEQPPLKLLKEEVLQRIFESEVPTQLSYSMMQQHERNLHEQNPHEQNQHEHNPHDRNSHEQNPHEQNPHEQGPHERNPLEQSNEHGYEQKHNVDEQALKIELSKSNGKRKRLECSECGRVFAHRNSLMYHMLSHAARQHSCTLCPKTFFTAAALKIHKRVHNGDKPCKCELCGRDFRQWSDLKYHTISLHSNEKHFKCEFCGKEFARKYSLNVHRRIHTGERNYKCDYCSKTFSASSYRLTHMRTHTGDRPYKCVQCEKSFRSAFDLRRHLLVHDKIRNRFDEHKPKAKERKPKPAKGDTTEITPEEIIKKIKLITPTPTTTQKSPKKKSTNKRGAPNVTVQNRDGQFKINDYQEEFDRPQFTKFKVVYSESDYKEPIPYKILKDNERDGFAVLRPLLREDRQYRENTDGKLQIFTHVEKKEFNGPIVTNSHVLGDIRHLEREDAREVRGDGNMNGEVTENGFIERLTALYNVPA